MKKENRPLTVFRYWAGYRCGLIGQQLRLLFHLVISQ